jgi:hypothetical protein
MFPEARLKEIEQAKRLVVLQSDIHRGLIGLETTSLRACLPDLGAARARLAASPPLMVATAVVAGMFAVRYWRKLAKHAPALFTLWRWWRSLRRRT